MLRILTFNGAIPPDPQSGEQWSDQPGMVSGGALLTSSSAGIVDHDVYILPVGPPTRHTFNSDVRNQVLGRVAAGGLLICFCEAPHIAFIPGATAVAQSGKIVRLVTAGYWAPLAQAIDHDPTYAIHLKIPGAEVLAVAGDGAPIAVIIRHGQGRIVVLPPMTRTRAEATRTILDEVMPEVLPDLARNESGPDEEPAPPPTWLGTYSLPGMAECVQSLEDLDAERTRIASGIAELKDRLAWLTAARGLLSLTGTRLEEVVRRVLNEMGFQCSKEGRVDAVHRCVDGRRLFIEIEGSKNSIGVNKGRQLVDYIHKASKSEPRPYGAVIGNPSQEDDPKERFAGQGLPFSKELQELGNEFNPPWRFLTTVELFDLYSRHLNGDSTAASEVANRLLPVRAQAGATGETNAS